MLRFLLFVYTIKIDMYDRKCVTYFYFFKFKYNSLITKKYSIFILEFVNINTFIIRTFLFEVQVGFSIFYLFVLSFYALAIAVIQFTNMHSTCLFLIWMIWSNKFLCAFQPRLIRTNTTTTLKNIKRPGVSVQATFAANNLCEFP